MPEKIPDFSKNQWEFIATIAAFGESVSIDVIGSLVPLAPGDFLDLLRKIEKIKWVIHNNDDMFSLSQDVPKCITLKLDRINSPKRVLKNHRSIRSKRFNKIRAAKCDRQMSSKIRKK